MSLVMIRCPETGRAVSTAIETEPATFRKLPPVPGHMHCPACGRDRPISRFRGRNKVPVEGREIKCRSCEREWWTARALDTQLSPPPNSLCSHAHRDGLESLGD